MAEMTKEQAAMVLDPESSEEAMEEIKRLSGYIGEDMELKVIRDACRVAVKVLRATGLPEPLGEPLTLEQLRGMDRPTPVWAEVAGKTIEGWDGYWCLCQNGKILAPSRLVEKAECMDGVEFYAYPPAQINREAWTAEWEEDGECDHKPCRIRDAEKWKKYKCSKCGYKAGRRTSQKYCPSCGKAMTPEAWAELEKRLRG